MNKTKEINASLALLAKGSFFVFLGLIFSKIFTYLYKIGIARLFGPEIYGLFSLAVMIVGFAIVIASLGLNDGLIRYISLYRKKKDIGKSKYLLKLTFGIIFISSMLVGIITFFLSEYLAVNVFHNSELTIFLKFFSIVIPFSVLSNTYLAVIRSYEKVGLYSFIVNFFHNGLKLTLFRLFILIGFKSEAIIYSYLFSFVGIMIISYYGARPLLKLIFFSKKIEKNRLKIRKEFFSYSWPIVFLGLIGVLFYWTDSFVIGYFKTASDVGFYNVAFTIAGLIGIAPELFMYLFLPLIVKEYSYKNLKVITEITKQVSKWIFILNLPLFIIIFLFPGTIINLLFGSQFIMAKNTLKILALGSLIAASFIPVCNNLLSMKGKSKLLLFNLIVISSINLVLNIFLVPRYGLEGAAISTVFSWFLLTGILVIQVKNNLSIVPIRKSMLKIGLISIIPTLLILYLKNFIVINIISLIILGVLFITLYFLLILLSKSLDKKDIMVLNKIKEKVFSKYKR